MKNKGNKWIVTLVAIFLLFSVIAISFGYFVANVTINGSIYDITGTVDSTTADITLTNLTSNVSITNGYPMTEAQAEESIDPYTFTITNNSTTRGAAVQIILETKSGTNTIPDRLIDAKIESNSGVLTNTNIFTSTTATQTGYQSAYVLWSGTINPGDKTFNLLLWIDENGDNNGSTNDVQNKAWYGKIIIKALDTDLETFTLSEYIESTYGMDNTLYYHTSDSTKWENGESAYSSLLAGDNSYRYAGASADVNNYVCFGTTDTSTCTSSPDTYLYRIIGVFDGQVKLIRNSSVGVISWDTDGSGINSSTYMSNNSSKYRVVQLAVDPDMSGSNNWSNSDMVYYLNGTGTGFLGTISANTWRTMIDLDHYWHVTGMTYSFVSAKTAYTAEIVNTSATWSGAVGLVYVSDFAYAASASTWNSNPVSGDPYSVNNNWLVITGNWTMQWTISPVSSSADNAFRLGDDHVLWNYVYNTYSTRPSFYLESTVELDTSVPNMNGSTTHPYILKLS